MFSIRLLSGPEDCYAERRTLRSHHKHSPALRAEIHALLYTNTIAPQVKVLSKLQEETAEETPFER